MSVIKSAITVSVFTFLCRILGFFRECLFTALLGVSYALDCFFVAVRLANTCRKIFAEGAFNASFLPRFSSVLETQGIEKANVLLSKIFSLMLVFVSIFCIAIIILYPDILCVIASGFKSSKMHFDLSVTLGRLMFPFLLFVSLTALFCGVSNSSKKFALPAIIFSTVNVFSIVIVVVCYFCGYSVEQNIFCLSIGVLASGVFQVAVMYLYTLRLGYDIKFTMNFFSKDVNSILKNMIPGIIGAGVWQINMLVDMHICSYLPSGTISCINFADKLNQFPLATIGTAIGTALLPALSASISRKDLGSANSDLQTGILFAMLFAVPAFVVLFSLSSPVVSCAYERLKFSSEHVVVVSEMLRGFVIGLPAYILSKIFSSAFFANRDTVTPIKCAALSVIANIVFLVALVPFGRIFFVPFSTAMSAWVNVIFLGIVLFKRYMFNLSFVFWKKFFVIVSSGVILFFEMQSICSSFWNPTFGGSYFKWLYTCSFGLTALFSYFSFISFFMFVFREQNMKFWEINSWTVSVE